MTRTLSGAGRHVMLDLETWGTRPGCALRSLGACVFGLGAGLGEDYYANIDTASCLDAGLIIDPQTQAWWAKQDAAAQNALNHHPLALATVVKEFHAWFAHRGGGFVWAQGANFDPVLWEAAALAVGATPPWTYHAVRDTRTVYAICGFDDRALPRAGTLHNALDDACHQARCVQAALAAAAARSDAVAAVLDDLSRPADGADCRSAR